MKAYHSSLLKVIGSTVLITIKTFAMEEYLSDDFSDDRSSEYSAASESFELDDGWDFDFEAYEKKITDPQEKQIISSNPQLDNFYSELIQSCSSSIKINEELEKYFSQHYLNILDQAHREKVTMSFVKKADSFNKTLIESLPAYYDLERKRITTEFNTQAKQAIQSFMDSKESLEINSLFDWKKLPLFILKQLIDIHPQKWTEILNQGYVKEISDDLIKICKPLGFCDEACDIAIECLFSGFKKYQEDSEKKETK